jgi:chromosome partitioning protein
VGLNPELGIEGVVLTMFDDRTNLAQQVMNELKNFFGEKLCRTSIPRNIRLAEAPSHGKAALVYDPRSKGAESYIRLAKELIERQPSAVSSQPSAETGTAEVRGGEAVEEIPAAADAMDKSA